MKSVNRLETPATTIITLVDSSLSSATCDVHLIDSLNALRTEFALDGVEVRLTVLPVPGHLHA
jgi:hypothetical protein